jgi:hypothetical protein
LSLRGGSSVAIPRKIRWLGERLDWQHLWLFPVQHEVLWHPQDVEGLFVKHLLIQNGKLLLQQESKACPQ